MTRILLRDLEPGRLYHIQARATNGEQNSQWSQLWDLQTTSDIMPPAAPTSLSWTVVGTAFKAVWTGPTTNQDGTNLSDFKDFQVKVYSPANSGVIATYYTTAARFDFSFEMNVNALGTPRAQVNIEVRARDNTGNLSSAATASATNPAPANVTGFTASGVTDAIALKWDQNTDTDLKYYQVYQGTSSGAETNLVYTGLGNSYKFDTLSASPQYFKIYAVDVFNTQSATAATANATARSSLGVDTTPPAAPTGVTVTSAVDTSDASGGRAYIDVSWTGVADTDLQNYSVRYSTGTTWQYINVPEGVTTARINGLRPNTAYNVAVAAVDFQGNSSAYTNAGTYPITTAKDTSAPATPTGVTAAAGVTTMTVYWNENSESDVKNGVGFYEVQLDTVNTFDSGNLITKQVSGTITSFSNLTSNTTYYTRVRAYDASGNVSSYTSAVSGTPRYIANADIQAGTINGDRITAATINGDRVIANTLDAATIKAGTTFSQNVSVGATFTMATSGIMKSSNYSAGSAGWQLTNTTLEINQGTIRAAALLLQNGHNMLHPAYADFEFVPSWYTGNISVFSDGGTGVWSIVDSTEVTPKFNTQVLKLVRTASAGTLSRYLFAPTTSTYNMPVDTNTDYIYSAYVYNVSASGSKNVALEMRRNSDGTQIAVTSPTAITDNSTWTRISGTFNSGTSTSVIPEVTMYSGGTIYVDGFQLEKKLTSDSTPSQWKPPSQTSIDGGIIRTGQIQSTAAANGLSGQPAWSINMAGSAQFGDAMVRGRLVVGDPSNPTADGVNSRIFSANYVAGSAGWIIRNDGYAEFNNVTIRGGNTISGTSLWYNGTPASGSLLYSIASAASTDSFGNSYPKGFGIGPATAPQVVLSSNATAGFIQFPTHRPIESAVGQILVGTVNQGAANEFAQLQFKGPTVTGATEQSSLFLNSQNNDGSSNANISLTTGTSSLILDKNVGTFSGHRLTVNPTASANSALFVNAASGHTGNLMRLALNSSDEFVVDSGGQITTYDSNSFGTYTPTTSGHGSAVFSTKTGWYQKIGKMVFVSIYLATATAGSGSNAITVDAPSNIDRTTRQLLSTHAENVTINALGASNAVRNGNTVSFTSGSGATFDRIRLDQDSANAGNLTGADLKNNSIIIIQGWYREA